MSGALESFFADYARRYTEGDVEGVTSLCLWPFVAVRRGRGDPHAGPRRGVGSLRFVHRRLSPRGGRSGVETGRDRRSPPRRALRLRDRALECAGRRRAGGPRYLDELPAALHFGRVALPLVHESLLSRAGWPAQPVKGYS